MDIRDAVEEICNVVADKVVERLHTPPAEAEGSPGRALPDVTFEAKLAGSVVVDATVAKLGQALEAVTIAGTAGELAASIKAMLGASAELQAERDAAVLSLEQVTAGADVVRARADKAEDALESLLATYRGLQDSAHELATEVEHTLEPVFAEQRKPAPRYLIGTPLLMTLRKLQQRGDELKARYAT